MRKGRILLIALVLSMVLAVPAVSFAGDRHSGGHDRRGYGRFHGGNHSLFTIAATAAGLVIGGFLNAPAYWGDPHYRNQYRCSDSETEFWTEDSAGYRYRVRTGIRDCD